MDNTHYNVTPQSHKPFLLGKYGARDVKPLLVIFKKMYTLHCPKNK